LHSQEITLLSTTIQTFNVSSVKIPERGIVSLTAPTVSEDTLSVRSGFLEIIPIVTTTSPLKPLQRTTFRKLILITLTSMRHMQRGNNHRKIILIYLY
jgi:hypothetical protein